MNNKNLFILCGCPGCGKSTWARAQVERLSEEGWKCEIISRDVIRFGLVSEQEEYFSKEPTVYSIFINSIQNAIDDEDTDIIIADATHLNIKSRNKLMDNLTIPSNVRIYMVDFSMPLDICLAQNAMRRGTRAFVPESALTRMFYSYTVPQEDENEHYHYDIIHEWKRVE